MTKEEFLEQLEDALVGEVPNAVIYDNKRYYERYFFSEMKMGRTEQEILEELGSPRLIAHTIIDMQGDVRQQYRESAYYKEDVQENMEQRKPHLGPFDLTTWYGRLFAWTGGIMGLILFIWLVSGLVSIAIQVAVPVLMILVIYNLIKSVMKR